MKFEKLTVPNRFENYFNMQRSGFVEMYLINQSMNFQGGLSNKQLPQGPHNEKKLI